MLELIDRRNAMPSRNPYVGIGLALCLLSLGCGGGGSSSPTTPSTLAITSGPTVSELTDNSATVTWTTNMESESRVDYGLTVSYGSSETSKAMVTSHAISLTGLSSSRTYHFMITSAAGTESVNSLDQLLTTEKDYAILLSEGWSAFEDAEYESAESLFLQALDKNPTGAQGKHGLAWAQALQDELTTAATNFLAAVSLGLTSAHPLAGLAAVYRDVPEYDLAIQYALDALALDSDYQFSHNSNFDYNDLHLILAQCYYAQGEYVSAQTEVDTLNPLNTLDPENPTYVRNLLLEIESLGDIHGGW